MRCVGVSACVFSRIPTPAVHVQNLISDPYGVLGPTHLRIRAVALRFMMWIPSHPPNDKHQTPQKYRRMNEEKLYSLVVR